MKYSLLLVPLCYVQADYAAYTTQGSFNTSQKYFVKLGAYSSEKNAQKRQKELDIKTKIIYLEKYYSIVSQEFENQESAKKLLSLIKKKYKDAYLVKLYKKEKIETVQVPVAPKMIEVSAFDKALALYNNKAYEDALAAFDRVLIDDENNTLAQYYYARTLYQLSLYKEAKSSLEKLLQYPLSKIEKKRVLEALRAVEKKTEHHFFNASLSIGAGYDDNINLTTDETETKYGNLTLINDTNKTDSTFAIASVALSHRYKAESFTWFNRFYSYNELAHSAKGNDLNFIDISTGIDKKFGKWGVALPFGANNAFVDGESVGYNLYTNPTLSYQLSKTLQSYIQTSYLDNTTKFSSGRDYRLLSGAVGIAYKKERLQAGLQTGLAQFRQKEALRYDVDRDNLSASLFSKYLILQNTFLQTSLAWNQEKYNILDKTMGYKREDERLEYAVAIGQEIGQNGLLLGSMAHRDQESNINAFAYKKNSYKIVYKQNF